MKQIWRQKQDTLVKLKQQWCGHITHAQQQDPSKTVKNEDDQQKTIWDIKGKVQNPLRKTIQKRVGKELTQIQDRMLMKGSIPKELWLEIGPIPKLHHLLLLTSF
jgi:hypothetical protein